ncbi:hypothetical protein [Halomonas sp. NO4]|uniref:hypothetical protein n=1 Tax=Halomonas sp. NO4 TaxID=2484813 RepID=UPI0013D3A01A|nr:hypothetical protein [Halomonas sp. NO4]
MPHSALPRHAQAALLLAALLAPALAFAGPEPTPFTARYQLELSGWPDATIDHRLVREGHHWLSEMRAAIALARGEERSRFRVAAEAVEPLHYASSYSLLGMGERYQLAPDALRQRLDRQTALFALSRRALAGECTTPCRLDYQDHEGEKETLEFRVLARERLSVPAGDFPSVTVEARDPAKPDRRLVLRFHAELPGLLLDAAYHRDGERRSRLALTALEQPRP